jgi:folate-binding protein YgfZ
MPDTGTVRAEYLRDRAVLSVAGAAARDFLQGLVTNDMGCATPGTALYAALLTPQGKILHEFLVAESRDGFLIDCARENAADLMRRLMLYRLRAKVDIAMLADHGVAAFWGGEAAAMPDAVMLHADPRLAALGARAIGPEAALAAALAPLAAGNYAAHALGLGIPASADLPPDSVFALDAGMEELHGVNFKKGCYVGQEVTARMKHRASARKRPLIAEIAGALPPPGTPLEAMGREIGTLATGVETRALALVRLDRLAEAQAASAPVTAAGLSVSLRKPAWIAV